jgi:hypothetical protein
MVLFIISKARESQNQDLLFGFGLSTYSAGLLRTRGGL